MPSQYEALAREALLEITTAEMIGDYLEQTDETGGAVSVTFDSKQPGYPGWKWTVSIAHVAGSEPTVLEAELLPGENALLAPDWVPWSDRLAEYEAAQELLGEVDPEESDDDDELEEVTQSAADIREILHAGDVDGVDIDDLDDEGSDDEGDVDDDERRY